VKFPPDAPNWGGVGALIHPELNLDNGPVFGTPDHPNPVYQALTGSSDQDFYTGNFHQLESAGQAGTFYIYSGWTQKLHYRIPVNVNPDFSIVIIGEPQFMSASVESAPVGPDAPGLANLEDTGYEPTNQAYKTDTSRH